MWCFRLVEQNLKSHPLPTRLTCRRHFWWPTFHNFVCPGRLQCWPWTRCLLLQRC